MGKNILYIEYDIETIFHLSVESGFNLTQFNSSWIISVSRIPTESIQPIMFFILKRHTKKKKYFSLNQIQFTCSVVGFDGFSFFGGFVVRFDCVAHAEYVSVSVLLWLYQMCEYLIVCTHCTINIYVKPCKRYSNLSVTCYLILRKCV